MPSTPWPGESPNLPVGCPRVVVGGPDVPFGGVTWPTSLSLRVNKLQYSTGGGGSPIYRLPRALGGCQALPLTVPPPSSPSLTTLSPHSECVASSDTALGPFMLCYVLLILLILLVLNADARVGRQPDNQATPPVP